MTTNPPLVPMADDFGSLPLFEQTETRLAPSLKAVAYAVKPPTPPIVQEAGRILSLHAKGMPLPDKIDPTGDQEIQIEIATASVDVSREGFKVTAFDDAGNVIGLTEEQAEALLDRAFTKVPAAPVPNDPVDPMKHAELKRDAGMYRADIHADERWKAKALLCIKALAGFKEWFTADDVHEYMAANAKDVHTHDTRALGPLLKKAQSFEWIKADGFIASRRRNAAPVVKWRSLLMSSNG